MGQVNRRGKRLAHEVAHGIMRTQDVKRKYEALIQRFKQIQAHFEEARTARERKRALAEMQKLSDQTHALLSNRPTRFTGA